ncbi:hypothetical protein GGX14DRAFT_445091 [Mycena pura]|uniref:Uncharacterized protein n=1 Tax=Mycena pura TaxID=153505 RepID=A0AAD6VLT9_9AGAR|nr:hypothetical protein GGX14DRAFT_445091 [Mycena pura]
MYDHFLPPDKALTMLMPFKLREAESHDGINHCRAGGTLFLRVYALYSLDKRILILLLCAGVTIVTVGAWSVVPVELSPIMRTSAPGCYVPQSKAQGLRMAAAWTAELAGDILVVCLTLYKSYAQRNGPLLAGSLWRIMIREVNLANILLFHIYTSNSLSWFTTAYAPKVSVAMISRLMLNLHVAAAQQIGLDADLELETIRFTRRSGTAFRGE